MNWAASEFGGRAFVVWGWLMIRGVSGPESDDAKMARRIAFGGMLIAAGKATARKR